MKEENKEPKELIKKITTDSNFRRDFVEKHMYNNYDTPHKMLSANEAANIFFIFIGFVLAIVILIYTIF